MISYQFPATGAGLGIVSTLNLKPFLLNRVHNMQRNYYSPLFVAALVCSILIPFFMQAQENELAGLHVLPPGFVMKFERMGGKTWQTFGTYDSFWIYPDGRIINNAGKTARVASEVVRKWQKTIMQQASSLTPAEITRLMRSCPDCSECLITIYDKDGNTTLDWVGRIRNAELAVDTIPGIYDWLRNLVWEPLMEAPYQAEGFIRSNRQPVEISEEVLQSQLIHNVEPVYPERAKSAQLSGKVRLLITVDESGVPADVLVISGNPILADSAVAAAIKWRYIPILRSHESGTGSATIVPLSAVVTVNYSITESGGTVEYMGDEINPVKNSTTRE